VKRLLLVGMTLLLSAGGASALQPDLKSTKGIPRDKAIADGIQRIEQECNHNGGGNWSQWFAKLQPFRTHLELRIKQAKAFNPQASGPFEGRMPVLEAKGEPPLFETAPANYIPYLYDAADMDSWLSKRPVLKTVPEVSRWLKKKGIDLIFIPVPKATEVYPDRQVEETPADRLVAPHMRKLVLELLQADVEVVDLLPLFLKARDENPEMLYLPVDPHWSIRAQQIACREIATRLRRYSFMQEALNQPPAYQLVTVPMRPKSAGYEALSPDQKKRVDSMAYAIFQLKSLKGQPTLSADSPVILIGDSFTDGVMQTLPQHLNMPINNASNPGQITEAIKDFVRDPSLLEKCKVIVWISNHAAFSHECCWGIPPLP
jgi:hypothetical protein